MTCVNCDDDLIEVFENSAAVFQYVDGLDVQLRLGYGQFRDHGADEDPAPRAVFCKGCAQKMYDNFLGIRRMLGEA